MSDPGTSLIELTGDELSHASGGEDWLRLWVPWLGGQSTRILDGDVNQHVNAPFGTQIHIEGHARRSTGRVVDHLREDIGDRLYKMQRESIPVARGAGAVLRRLARRGR